MAIRTEFSQREWDRAPHYEGPEPRANGIVVLAFDDIREIARNEKQDGAFRESVDKTIAKAPLFVSGLPGAMYIIEAQHPSFTPNHNTSDPETLIVVDGALHVAPNNGSGRDENIEDHRFIWEGEVAEFYDEAIAMQAIKPLINPYDLSPARCLALALYRDNDLVIEIETT